MENLSVVIITLNEERNIARCIDSIKEIADEIIVLDSFSTDKTTELAAERGARLFQQPFAGYIEQKNIALGLATHDYVLCLDADEAIDEDLKESIIMAKKNFKFAGYSMNRCTNYCGKFILHGSWYPDKKLRLFNRKSGQWGGINPHDKVILISSGNIQHLGGKILHFSYNNLEEHIQQNNKFSTLSAEAYFTKGKRSNWLKILLSPTWAFLQSYIIRLGFMDGFHGYVIAKNIAHLTFMKYYKLYALHKGIPLKKKDI